MSYRVYLTDFGIHLVPDKFNSLVFKCNGDPDYRYKRNIKLIKEYSQWVLDCWEEDMKDFP